MLCRLIFDEAAPGLWNMAADEWLLGRAADDRRPTLRFYRWDEPTLSLGYFQRYADREAHAASRDLTAVRRSTGGGALIHHHELTYSLTFPPGHPLGRDAVALTCLVHRALVDAVEYLTAESGWLTTCEAPTDSQSTEPFLCFQRRSPGDLIARGEHKVCGSAQRRRRGALLQHGGALLARSDRAPELPGLAEMLPQAARLASVEGSRELAALWSRKILHGLDLRPEASGWAPAEREAIGASQRDPETNHEWLIRR